ncbi:MAG: ThiF family adenylyltransferase [Candidatus Obscuribacterales bacterium]|nr:ThiF family adenylyltransferase [Candidatus Obscuribacterales bacterium]
MTLKPEQLARYKSQLALPAMSEAAQLKLLDGAALILGLEGTGSSVSRHLVKAGVGRIGLVDSKGKCDSALHELGNLNPDVHVVGHSVDFDAHNAESVVREYDVIVDSLSDWQSKILASDVAMHLEKALVHGGLFGFSCQVYTMVPGRSACLRCVLPLVGLEDVPMEKLSADFAPTVEVAAAMQASAVIRLIAGLGGIGGASLIQFDALTPETSVIRELSARADCPDCRRS